MIVRCDALSAPPDSEGRIKPTGEGYRHTVRENFLETMGIPLLYGRTFTAADRLGAPPVVMLSDGVGAKILGGWLLSGIYSARSGRAFTVTQGNNNVGAVPTGNLNSLDLVAKLVAHGASPNALLKKEPRMAFVLGLGLVWALIVTDTVRFTARLCSDRNNPGVSFAGAFAFAVAFADSKT
mgnify:CR=1 FL=1